MLVGATQLLKFKSKLYNGEITRGGQYGINCRSSQCIGK
jgi:hypothetical protein